MVSSIQILYKYTNQNYICYQAFKYHQHHQHHVVPLARVSMTLSHHFSLSFIASGRSSGLHPVSSHSCCMYVRASRPAFAWPYAGFHRGTSLMSSSLLLQQCPTCLVRLTCIVFVMGGRWLYSWCLVGCCRQDLFNIEHDYIWYQIIKSNPNNLYIIICGVKYSNLIQIFRSQSYIGPVSLGSR